MDVSRQAEKIRCIIKDRNIDLSDLKRTNKKKKTLKNLFYNGLDVRYVKLHNDRLVRLHGNIERT